MKEISLYVHIPFCLQKCNYCNFYSLPYNSDLANDYLAALIKELSEYRNEGYSVNSIYLGGGTPSLLTFYQLVPLITAIGRTFHIDENAEITIEANPATITREKAQDWKTLGFNRVSIGAQSFNDNELSVLGRLHSADEIGHAVRLVKEHFTENVSLDLMYGIPQQSFISWQKSLRLALELKPTHLSSYCLSLERGTPLFTSQKKYTFPSEKQQRGMYYMMKSIMEKNGFIHYEISNFCLPGYLSRHNDSYWLGNEYIGLGAAAHSFIDMERIEKLTDASCYISKINNNQSVIKSKKCISFREYISDCIFLGLRRLEGIDLTHFKKKHGFNILNEYKHEMDRYLKTGYLTVDNNHLKLTRKALFISDEILSEFV
ncbi:MAG TPA: radical SAM family heme chaperone HemW [Candidatus Cloacimonetes bacterium]|nr:radical SAM family heme chaperone HemW [Candidatus Cloacimonadota bacterium]HEX37245.1 radical SAM family heme chaperone HemW [Candidatus Cloacimonadota bacterium]